VLKGALVLYLKSNSFGEYIYDFAWAQAFANQGLEYYPKLTAAIPFTSATGPKLLLDGTLDPATRLQVAQQLVVAGKELASRSGVSSFHALFLEESEIPTFQNEQMLIRHSYQYHWWNQNYRDFADFLQKLRSKRRSEILRERRQVHQAGLQISRLTGEQLGDRHAQAFYQFYVDTAEKKGGYAYLTLPFFLQIFRTMSDRILLVYAERDNQQPVAGALNFYGRSTLFGRNWGCLEDHKSLHLELCYYQGIEFAIEKQFRLFEAGAQGEHKFYRGFLPRLNYSAHHIHNAPLGRAIGRFIEDEKAQIAALFAEYARQTPYSRATQD